MNIRTKQDKIIIDAPAKINLGLDIVGRREDGYHMVKMVMQTVTIYDEVTLYRTKKSGIELTCDCADLAVDKHNLIVTAAQYMMNSYNLEGGVRIHLVKRIPIAAGMAGGSADAAATLIGINELYKLGLTTLELEHIGVNLGADVPYCIRGGTVLAEGIGEQLTHLGPMPLCTLVIVKPLIAIATQEAYKQYDKLKEVDHPDIDQLIEAMKESNWNRIESSMGNVLEIVSKAKHPEIGIIEEKLNRAGASRAMMTGSGPSVFGLFHNEQEADACIDRMKQMIEVEGVYKAQFLNVL